MEIKLFLSEHIPDVLSFERQRLLEKHSEFEAEMASWDAPWRQESLEHYVQLGWSFVMFEDNKLCGYVLAQPLLFVNGMTQSLWVEYVSADRGEQTFELLDVSIKWAKSKHLQKVLFHQDVKTVMDTFPQVFPLQQRSFFDLATTRMAEDAP